MAASLALLAADANFSHKCGTPKESVVHAAARIGRGEILRALIEHGADVNAVATEQETPLHDAALFNKARAIDMLVEVGANMESADRTGDRPLRLAARYIHQSRSPVGPLEAWCRGKMSRTIASRHPCTPQQA